MTAQTQAKQTQRYDKMIRTAIFDNGQTGEVARDKLRKLSALNKLDMMQVGYGQSRHDDFSSIKLRVMELTTQNLELLNEISKLRYHQTRANNLEVDVAEKSEEIASLQKQLHASNDKLEDWQSFAEKARELFGAPQTSTPEPSISDGATTTVDQLVTRARKLVKKRKKNQPLGQELADILRTLGQDHGWTYAELKQFFKVSNMTVADILKERAYVSA